MCDFFVAKDPFALSYFWSVTEEIVSKGFMRNPVWFDTFFSLHSKNTHHERD